MRDELLNETLFFTMGHARAIISRWVDDYNTERPHSSLGYATPAAYGRDLSIRLQRSGISGLTHPCIETGRQRARQYVRLNPLGSVREIYRCLEHGLCIGWMARLPTTRKRRREAVEPDMLVAGAGFEPATFRL